MKTIIKQRALLLPILIIFNLIFSITSCTKDNEDRNQEQVRLLLKKVIKDNILVAEYTYFDDNQIKTARYYDDLGNFSSRVTYEYLSDTAIANSFDSNNDLIGYKKYYRVNSNLVRKDIYSIYGSLGYILYVYNDTSPIYTKIQTFSSSDILFREMIVQYTDENFSYVGTLYNSSGDIIETSTLTKDNKIAYFQSLILPVFGETIVHNSLNLEVINENGDVNNNKSYDRIYEYNSDNYPISEIKTYLDGTVYNYHYEYY